MSKPDQPNIVVLSSLFPSAIQPGAGLFVRERAFRVGKYLPITVVAPSPWFPFQAVLRLIKPHFRPGAPVHERQSDIDVWYPRFFSLPGLLKGFDGIAMALGAFRVMRKMKQEGRLDIIDAHFAYPDGYAASLLSAWLKVPFTITLRGTETRLLQDRRFEQKMMRAISQARQVFSVSDSLRQLVIAHGADPGKVEVVGNGVDTQRFSPKDRTSCRAALGISPTARVLVSVGGLVPRKGFHRVIELMPHLLAPFPDLIFLIVGSASAEGDIRVQLEQQVSHLKVNDSVRFLGAIPPDELPAILSAADVFVLATSNEGWANVFLEAMACGLPVVTTNVGGNQEVVCSESLGFVVPFGDAEALLGATKASLEKDWDRGFIRAYAERNAWDERVNRLCSSFQRINGSPRGLA